LVGSFQPRVTLEVNPLVLFAGLTLPGALGFTVLVGVLVAVAVWVGVTLREAVGVTGVDVPPVHIDVVLVTVLLFGDWTF
jgi:hypothetical protein